LNTIGEIFKITSFGESHGKAVGVVVDGVLPNVPINLDFIQTELDRRKPGQSEYTTQRKESDVAEIISGLYNGKTTGAPITCVIPNLDARSQDYDHLKQVYRPSHSDFTYTQKYKNVDPRGGGRSSARATAGWVAAGAIAKQILSHLSDVKIQAYTNQIGKITFLSETKWPENFGINNPVNCPDYEVAEQMMVQIAAARNDGDSLGGIIRGGIFNAPIGLGEPLFNKFNAALAQAMFSINAVKGFQIGGGFAMTQKKGSEINDSFYEENGKIKTRTNFSGGIQGGITNGMPVIFDVAFKPTSTIKIKQETLNHNNEKVELSAKGRHDPCVVPRAVAIVEAMAAITTLDMFLLNKAIN
jgi:chorismate synthase